MSYIIVERDVKIEVVDESDGVIYEAGHSVAGLGRCATRLPAFTEAETRAELGDEVCDLIERTFDNLAHAAIEAKQLET